MSEQRSTEATPENTRAAIREAALRIAQAVAQDGASEDLVVAAAAFFSSKGFTLAINHSEVKTNELPAAIREAALRIAQTTAKDGTNDKLVAAAAAFFSTDYVEHVMAGSAHARWG